MKHTVFALLAGTVVAATSFAQTPGAAAAPAPAATSTNTTPVESRFSSPGEKNSYAIGVMIANDMQRNLKRSGYEVDTAVVTRAFAEAFGGKPTLLTAAEAESIVRAYGQDLRQKAEEKRKVDGEKNKAEGEKFLTENKAKDGIITLPSGLQYKVLKEGAGAKPGTNDTVVTHYRGTLLDGTEFDSSITRGQPATFGVGRVIKGWTEALQLMPVGSKWQLFVPGDLAYGATGAPPKIGPNAVLTFDIELLEIKPPATATGGAPTPAPAAVTSDIIKVPSKAELEKGAKIEIIKKDELDKLQKEAQTKAAAGTPAK